MLGTSTLLALALAGTTDIIGATAAEDVCTGKRCDTAACPCGCECGNKDDPGLCYVPKVAAACNDGKQTVLVTGATGRTGSHLYKRLVADGVYNVRAFVRDVAKARKELGCKKCDPSEGIFVGNVSDDSALRSAAHGTSAVAIAVGIGGNATQAETKAVEYTGVQKQVAALAQQSNVAAIGGLAKLRVVLCSSMGTLDPSPPPYEGGSVLFWKLNAEAFIAASGLSFAVVKPCGLLSLPGGHAKLLVGHDDALLATTPPVVPRDDVARVMQAALSFPADGAPLGLRFDLCSKAGTPTTDLQALLKQSLYAWQQ